MVTRTELVVRSTELDAFGHVNNAKYLEYLEWGRFDWFAAAKLSLELGPGLTAVVANVNLNYRREARLGERLVVSTRLASRGTSSFRFAQEITNERGDVVADAGITAVMFDTAKRSSAKMPEALAARLDGLLRDPER